MKVFVATADASGDLHAAALIEALRKRDPALESFGLGGKALLAAGMEPIASQADLAVGGLLEIASSAPQILRAYTDLRRALVERRPDLAIFVDSPDLNLRLASVAKRNGLRVLYYIAPQVWAWRSGRVRQLRRRTDGVGVIFPFEVAPLLEAGVNARFVGHPLVDRMARVRRDLRPEEVARELGLDLVRPILSLLPGSRHNEFDANLPVMLETARLLRSVTPELQVCLLVAPTLEATGLEVPDFVRVVHGRTHEAMAISTCLVLAPGTVTLEAALLGVPMIATHRVNPLSFELIRRLAHVPSSCMVNLLAGAGVVPERMQWQSRPAALAALAARLLRDTEERRALERGLAEVSSKLGEPGAAEQAADFALEVAGRA